MYSDSDGSTPQEQAIFRHWHLLYIPVLYTMVVLYLDGLLLTSPLTVGRPTVPRSHVVWRTAFQKLVY